MKPLEETPTRPADYAAISAGYGALLGAIVLGAREHPDPLVRHEIPALGLATFALSKLIAKEKVETWVREPFVEETPQGRRPKGRGLLRRRRAAHVLTLRGRLERARARGVAGHPPARGEGRHRGPRHIGAQRLPADRVHLGL